MTQIVLMTNQTNVSFQTSQSLTVKCVPPENLQIDSASPLMYELLEQQLPMLARDCLTLASLHICNYNAPPNPGPQSGHLQVACRAYTGSKVNLSFQFNWKMKDFI